MEKILVLDFGGQYNQLIARRVRDHGVFAEILPYTTSPHTAAPRGHRQTGIQEFCNAKLATFWQQ